LILNQFKLGSEQFLAIGAHDVLLVTDSLLGKLFVEFLEPAMKRYLQNFFGGLDFQLGLCALFLFADVGPRFVVVALEGCKGAVGKLIPGVALFLETVEDAHHGAGKVGKVGVETKTANHMTLDQSFEDVRRMLRGSM
jgi:hypothetical protein